jgi:hypothetical protein
MFERREAKVEEEEEEGGEGEGADPRDPGAWVKAAEAREFARKEVLAGFGEEEEEAWAERREARADPLGWERLEERSSESLSEIEDSEYCQKFGLRSLFS